MNAPGGELTIEYFTEGNWVEARSQALSSGTTVLGINEYTALIRFRYRAREPGSIRAASLTLV